MQASGLTRPRLRHRVRDLLLISSSFPTHAVHHPLNFPRFSITRLVDSRRCGLDPWLHVGMFTLQAICTRLTAEATTLNCVTTLDGTEFSERRLEHGKRGREVHQSAANRVSVRVGKRPRGIRGLSDSGHAGAEAKRPIAAPTIKNVLCRSSRSRGHRHSHILGRKQR